MRRAGDLHVVVLAMMGRTVRERKDLAITSETVVHKGRRLACWFLLCNKYRHCFSRLSAGGNGFY